MFHQYKLFKSLIVISLSTLGLFACTPSFQTTAEKCATYSPVTLPITETNDDSEFKVLAGSTSNNYKLHLEDALNSLENIQSKASDGTTSPLSSDEQTAIQFILDKAKEKMGYVIENGKVESASNPLDYLESLFSATDADEVIETFADAKRNLVRAISKADSVCNYTNSGINLVIEDPNIPSNENNIVKTVNAQLSLNYNPDSKGENKDTVDQIFLISLYDEPIEDLDISKRKAKSFSSISRIADTEFKAAGASLAKVRQINFSDSITNETFFFDDDFDQLKLGQLVTTKFNSTCKDPVTAEDVDCTDPSTTRIPQHQSCSGDQAQQEWLQGKCPINVDARQRHPACPSDRSLSESSATATDETGQIQINSFPVVPGLDSLTGIQRLRLEVDYPLNEIRLYASKYAEKIEIANPDANDPQAPENFISNPTRCEKQAVLNDLVYLSRDDPDFAGARLTLVEDPNYDLIPIVDVDGNPVLDDEDNPTYNEPTPVFVFEGTAIIDRQN